MNYNSSDQETRSIGREDDGNFKKKYLKFLGNNGN